MQSDLKLIVLCAMIVLLEPQSSAICRLVFRDTHPNPIHLQTLLEPFLKTKVKIQAGVAIAAALAQTTPPFLLNESFIQFNNNNKI